jgi:hypothetical protein
MATNFALLARRDAVTPLGAWATLEISYDENLKPWEQVKRPLETSGVPSAYANPDPPSYVSRGGPFTRISMRHNRDAYAAHSRAASRLPRRRGRRGALGFSWHVAWYQGSGLDAPSHEVDVILPSELTVVRLRMLRGRDNKRVATVADQVGSRATVIAPQFDDGRVPNSPSKSLRSAVQRQSPPAPTLLSLVLTQRTAGSWWAGAVLALLQGHRPGLAFDFSSQQARPTVLGELSRARP